MSSVEIGEFAVGIVAVLFLGFAQREGRLRDRARWVCEEPEQRLAPLGAPRSLRLRSRRVGRRSGSAIEVAAPRLLMATSLPRSREAACPDGASAERPALSSLLKASGSGRAVRGCLACRPAACAETGSPAPVAVPLFHAAPLPAAARPPPYRPASASAIPACSRGGAEARSAGTARSVGAPPS